MSKSSAPKIKLNSFDDLFGTNESVADGVAVSDVKEIALSDLHDFKNHPFKIHEDKLAEMVDSIKQMGVLVPGICRMHPEGGYEIIAGHTRKRACELAGLPTMPMVIKNLGDDEATIVMVDTNIQREDILPSEKAKAYAMRYAALKHQGTKGNALTAISDEAGESAKQVQRYIYIARLNDGLLNMVDDKKLPLRTAVDLSFLKETEQMWVLDAMNEMQMVPSMEQAQELKNLSQKKELVEVLVLKVLAPVKERQVKRKVVIKQDRLSEYFPEEYTGKQMEQIIYELLEEWKNKR